MLWPAAANKQAFFFYDSYGYLHDGSLGISKITGGKFQDAWLNPSSNVQKSENTAPNTETYPRKPITANAPQAGRSVYYGVLADLAASIAGVSAVIIIQCIVISILFDIVYHMFELGFKARLVVSIAISFLSSASIYTDFILPDIWVGMAFMALVAQFGFPEKNSLRTTIILNGCICYGALVHTTVVLALAVFLAMSTAVALRIAVSRTGSIERSKMMAMAWAPSLRRVIVACVVAGSICAGGRIAIDIAARHFVGVSPVMPPFLTARLIADGTGARYLRERCTPARFDVCQYSGRHFSTSDEFLWGRVSPFGAAGPAERRRLSAEDAPFALAVATNFPIQQVLASGGNFIGQLLDIDLKLMNYDAHEREWFGQQMPASAFAPLRRTLAARQKWPVLTIGTVHGLSISVVLFAIVLLWRSMPMGHRRFILGASAICVVDAFVCGVASEVSGRYEGRVAWLICFAGFCAIASAVQRSSQPRLPPVPPLELTPTAREVPEELLVPA
jgi:hypothetical protein